MSLASIVRSGVALADKLTTSLQVTVGHYTGTRDAYGKVTWDAGVARLALVESVKTNVRTASGDVIYPKTKVSFLRPVTITQADKLVLPDGSTGPILDIVGLTDPATNGGYYALVYLG